MERIILTTGGTGGHIFPALAAAEEIRRRFPKAMILFMGGQDGPEADLAVAAGIDFVGLPVRGVVGRGLRGVAAGFGMFRGIMKARGIIKKFKPELVVGFGGYAAFAGVCAAHLAKVPTAVHEQNSVPGLANKLAGRFARRIFLSLPDDSGAFDPEKCLLVGNPVRADIAALAAEARGARHAEIAAGRRPRLLVVGGSLGAKALNDAVVANLDAFSQVDLHHQTGKIHYEEVRKAYRAAKTDHALVEPFITDMAEAYANADLALCRAGASTLAELACAGLPVILVPYPFAARDHQLHNAKAMVERDAAVLLQQSEFAGDKAGVLAERALELLGDPARLTRMSEAARAVALPQAASSLVNGLEKILQAEKLKVFSG